MRRLLVTAVLSIMALSAANPALADNPNVNMDDFQPSVHAWDIGNIYTTRIASPFQWNAGIWLSYRKDALSLQGSAVNSTAQVVSDQLVGDVYFAMAFFNQLSVGLDIPVFFLSNGDDPGAIVGSLSKASGASLGDVRLSAKLKFWDNKNKGIGVAMTEDLTVPTATGDKFTGEANVTSRTGLVVDWTWQGFIVALNAGYLIRENSTAFDPTIGDELQIGVGAQIPILCDHLELLFSANTRTYAAEPFANESSFASLILGGVRGRILGGLTLTGLGGGSAGTMPGAPAWQASINIGWEPIPGSCDQDDDGVPDSDDACPTIPGPEDQAGCPDRDRDGTLDSDDLCPDVPGKANLRGCPDTDGDGVADYQDRCPKIPGPMAYKGCPDKDGDGIIDSKDKCPNVPGVASLQGCPDTDGDGITDARDQCPEQAGPLTTKGCPDQDDDGIQDSKDKCPDVWGQAKYQGCPPPAPKKIKITRKKIVILDKVYFGSNSDRIEKRSYSILNDVATVLRDNPWIKRVQIEGHTDDVGRDDYNKRLSQKRADSVVAYLVKQGVEPGRLEGVGYGEERPLIDEKTKKARAENRRVEFSIIDPK